MSGVCSGVLHEEHVLLGASFSEGCDDLNVVRSYAAETSCRSLSDATFLADLTGCLYELVGGPCASALIESACCGAELSVGDVAFEGVLSGDGSVLSTPLVLRTGDEEYVVLDVSHRGPALLGWMGFLRQIQQGGTTPFAQTTLDDASGMLVPLLLMGRTSHGILMDYLGSSETLPAPGKVCSLSLDAIPALVAALPCEKGMHPGYLLLVPAARARVIWRSLLSFTEVNPVGHDALRAILCDTLPWGEALSAKGPVRVGREQLGSWSLVRETSDFIGARGLFAQED